MAPTKERCVKFISRQHRWKLWRPSIQSKLVEIDDLFDCRYNAFLHQSTSLDQCYFAQLRNRHETLLSNIKANIFESSNNNESVLVVCISSSLQSLDKDHLIRWLSNSLSSECLVIESHCDCIDSPDDILSEVRDNFRMKFYDKGKIKCDADTPILQSIYSAIKTLQSEKPECDNIRNTVILLYHAEKISPNILSDLFKSITLTNTILNANNIHNDSIQNNIHMHLTLILVYSSCRPLPFHANGFTSTNISFGIYNTCSPLELYDNIIMKIISSKRLNIIIDNYSDIHFDFFRNHQCVWTVIDRYHFEYSLLYCIVLYCIVLYCIVLLRLILFSIIIIIII